MNTLSYPTVSARPATVVKKWKLIDAEAEIVGRLAAEVASILRGKHKPSFTPHVDCGDNVIIINADKIRLTGNKMVDKEYRRYTGYPGGLRSNTAKAILLRKPGFILENAIRGMLPKTRLGRAQFRNLYVYAGPEHPHQAQQPEPYEFVSRGKRTYPNTSL